MVRLCLKIDNGCPGMDRFHLTLHILMSGRHLTKLYKHFQQFAMVSILLTDAFELMGDLPSTQQDISVMHLHITNALATLADSIRVCMCQADLSRLYRALTAHSDLHWYETSCMRRLTIAVS